MNTMQMIGAVAKELPILEFGARGVMARAIKHTYERGFDNAFLKQAHENARLFQLSPKAVGIIRQLLGRVK